MALHRNALRIQTTEEASQQALTKLRGFVIALAALAVVFGLTAVVSAFVRGLGLSVGALVGLVLIAVGGTRLFIEARREHAGSELGVLQPLSNGGASA